MKKKNILFVLFIIFGIPFLFLALLIGGGIYLFTEWRKEPPPPVVTVVQKVQAPAVPETDIYNVETLNFNDFSDHLNLAKNTSMHVSYFWDQAKGKRVKWMGRVIDVKGIRGKAEITVASGKDPDCKDFNIVLTSYKPEQAAALKKGESISFSGEVCNYKEQENHPIIVYLNNVEILH